MADQDIKGVPEGLVEEEHKPSARPEKVKGVPDGVVEEQVKGVPEGVVEEPVKASHSDEEPSTFDKAIDVGTRYGKGLLHSLGLPTSVDEYKAAAEDANKLDARHLIDAAGGPALTLGEQAYDSAKKTIKGLVNTGHEAYEAGQNIAAGQPLIPNLAKPLSELVDTEVRAVPFIGEPTVEGGHRIARKDYAGAAGELTGVIGQVVAPEAVDRLVGKTGLDFHTDKVAKAQAELKAAQKSADPYRASIAKGERLPEEVQKPIDKAQAKLDEAQKHLQIAREAQRGVDQTGRPKGLVGNEHVPPSTESNAPPVEPLIPEEDTHSGLVRNDYVPPSTGSSAPPVEPVGLADTLERTEAAVEPLVKEAEDTTGKGFSKSGTSPPEGKPKALAKIKVAESAKPVVGTPENLQHLVPPAETPEAPIELPRGFGRIGKSYPATAPVAEPTAELVPERTPERTESTRGIPERDPNLMERGEEGREEPKSAEYHPDVQEQVTNLSDENLRKLAKAHGLNPDEYDFTARDSHRHRVERDQLAADITEQMGDDEKSNIGRNAERLAHNADMAIRTKAQRAESLFPRLRGPVDEFGNPQVSGGAPDAEPEGEAPWKVKEPEKPLIAPEGRKWQNATAAHNQAQIEEHNLKVQKLVDKGVAPARAEQLVTDAEKELIPTRELPERQSAQQVKDLHDETLKEIAKPNGRFVNAVKKTIRAQGVPEDEVADIANDVIANFIEAVRIGETKGELPGVKTADLRGGFRLPEGEDGAAAVAKWLNTNARNAAIDHVREGSDLVFDKESGQPRRVDDVLDSVTGKVVEHGTGRTLKAKPAELPQDQATSPRTGRAQQRPLLPREANAETFDPVTDTKLQARALREHLAANPGDVEFLQEVQAASGHGAAAFDPKFKLSRENAAAIGKKFGISAAKVRERLGNIARDVQGRYLGGKPTPKAVATGSEEGPTRSAFGRITVEKPPAEAKPTESFGNSEGFASSQPKESAPVSEVARVPSRTGRFGRIEGTTGTVPPPEPLGVGRTLPLEEPLPVGKEKPLIPERSQGTAQSTVDLQSSRLSRERIASTRLQEAQAAYDAAETPVAKRRAKQALEDAKDSLNLIRNKTVSGGSQGATTINASGESSASQEAINRTRSEKTHGLRRIVRDTRSSAERPLIGVDAVDYQPRPYESVEFRGGGRDGEVISAGARARGYRRIQ